MGGLGLLVRAETRRRWLALVLIGLLVGGVGAAVTASVAGARRSETAYDRLAERTGQPDATLVSFVDPGFLEEVISLPEVETVWRMRGVVGRGLDLPTVNFLSVVAGPPRPDGLFEPLVEEGRLPADDAVGEVAVSQGLADAADVSVGDRVRLGMLTQEEFESFDEGFGLPDGPTVDLEVVGTFTVGGNDSNEQVGILGSPAFAEVAADAGGGDGAMFLLSDEPGAVERFEAGVLAASEDFDLPPDAVELGAYDLRLAAEDRVRSQASALVVSRGLLLVGAAGLLIGILGVAQTVQRHQSRSLGAQSVLGALGLDRRQRVLASLAPFALVTAPVAAVITVAGAIALSPLLPIGSARSLEPSPGVELNLAVLAIGAVATVALSLLVIALVAGVMVRRPALPPRGGVSLAARGARVGLPLPVTIGGSLALDRGRSGTSVPVRAALAGGVLAVAAVVGSAAFAASLDRLIDTPARYGSPSDLLVADAQDELFDQLQDDPDVEAVLETRGFDLVVEGTRRDASSAEVRKGSIGFNYISGRAPVGPAEIAVGPALASRLDVGIGDEVTLDESGEAATVVGVVLARGDTGNSYSDSVIVDDEVREASAAGGSYREALIRYRDGVDVDAVGEALGADWEVERIEPPVRIVDLAQIRNLPLVLAGAAAVLGIGLLAHALVVTVRRRGRDLALVRALGARPRETVASVLAMMAIIIVIGVAAGIPLGILAGNLAWRAVADSLYVADDLAVPILVVLACLPIALLVGLLTAVLPGRRASRLEVAAQLREE